MHGLEYEKKLDGLLSGLGVQVIKNEEEDLYQAIDSRAVGIAPHGERCSCEPQPCDIVLQYTLQDDATRKLKRFTHLARERGGKNLYVLLASPEWIERPWMHLLAKQIREAIWRLASAADLNIVKVLRIKTEEKLWCRLCNKATRDCDCLRDLKEKGEKLADIEKGLSRATRADYSYEAELLDPEEVVHDLRVIRDSHQKSETRISGTLKQVGPGGGQIKIRHKDDSRELIQFMREDIRDSDLRQLITNWHKAKRNESLRAPTDRLLKVLDKSDLLDGLEVSFETEETGKERRGARWILPANEEQLAFLRQVVWLLERNPAALGDAIESAGRKAARGKEVKQEPSVAEEILTNI